MSDNSLVGKLRAMADKIDPQVDGIVVLIVGDVQIELGITATGDFSSSMRRGWRQRSSRPSARAAPSPRARLPGRSATRPARLICRSCSGELARRPAGRGRPRAVLQRTLRLPDPAAAPTRRRDRARPAGPLDVRRWRSALGGLTAVPHPKKGTQP